MKYKVSIEIEVGEYEGFKDKDVIHLIEQVIHRGVGQTCLINQQEIAAKGNLDYVSINNEISDGMDKAVIVKDEELPKIIISIVDKSNLTKGKEYVTYIDSFNDLIIYDDNGHEYCVGTKLEYTSHFKIQIHE